MVYMHQVTIIPTGSYWKQTKKSPPLPVDLPEPRMDWHRPTSFAPSLADCRCSAPHPSTRSQWPRSNGDCRPRSVWTPRFLEASWEGTICVIVCRSTVYVHSMWTFNTSMTSLHKHYYKVIFHADKVTSNYINQYIPTPQTACPQPPHFTFHILPPLHMRHVYTLTIYI